MSFGNGRWFWYVIGLWALHGFTTSCLRFSILHMRWSGLLKGTGDMFISCRVSMTMMWPANAADATVVHGVHVAHGWQCDLYPKTIVVYWQCFDDLSANGSKIHRYIIIYNVSVCVCTHCINDYLNKYPTCSKWPDFLAGPVVLLRAGLKPYAVIINLLSCCNDKIGLPHIYTYLTNRLVLVNRCQTVMMVNRSYNSVDNDS